MTITACTACRVLKVSSQFDSKYKKLTFLQIKCVQMVTGKPCKRCEALGSNCFIPPRILGRKLGSKKYDTSSFILSFFYVFIDVRWFSKKIKTEKCQDSLRASGSRSLSILTESASERQNGVISLANQYHTPLQTPTDSQESVNYTDVRILGNISSQYWPYSYRWMTKSQIHCTY